MGVISTPLNSANFIATISVPLAAQATAIVGKQAVVANLECATVEDAVIFSLTFQERITYVRAADSVVVTESFALPYANSFTVPGTIAGMNCEIAAILTGLTANLTAPGVVTNNISFTITVSTFFPPPEAQDFDSNQISLALA